MDITRCSVCAVPAHASETNDLDQCAPCAVVARLAARGYSRERIHALAMRAMVRLYERGQSGAHLWGLVRNVTA